MISGYLRLLVDCEGFNFGGDESYFLMLLLMRLFVFYFSVYVEIRFHGGHDLESGVCFPEYIFQEGHEGEIS